MSTITCKIKGYIQPFERHLALEELKVMSKGDIMPMNGNAMTSLTFAIPENIDIKTLRSNLAYWEMIGEGPDNLTVQVQREATSIVARNGITLDDLTDRKLNIALEKIPNRRCLRYGTHGLHEYRGKFFPQLVRALINIAQVPRQGMIFDPMCGSGTTLIESSLSGRNAYGLDMNPLSVFISKVKCQSMNLEAFDLINAFRKLSNMIEKPTLGERQLSYFTTLPIKDQEYLRRWFSKNSLQELDFIYNSIQKISMPEIQNVYLVCLSDILRAVSWQKEDDLRTRKNITGLPKGMVISYFLDKVLRSTKMLIAFFAERDLKSIGKHLVYEGDARMSCQALESIIGEVDAVITSPPYATALPYLDTDRLSLIYLGLLPRENHRDRDTLMIGNREITGKNRISYLQKYEKNKMLLPQETRSLIEKIHYLNEKNPSGFRRKNISALLVKYFFDMRSVLEQQFNILRSKGILFMVIGNNKTTAGSEIIEIETAKHLSKIAQTIGFQAVNDFSMDMLVSRDIFRKNSMSSESIIMMRKN